MDYESKHSVDPFYIKAIRLAGEEPTRNLTNKQARDWVNRLHSESCEHSNISKFVRYQDFLRELRREVHLNAEIYGYDDIEDALIIDAALQLIEAGYGVDQILGDLELFFTAYREQLRDTG